MHQTIPIELNTFPNTIFTFGNLVEEQLDAIDYEPVSIEGAYQTDSPISKNDNNHLFIN